jgi:hypothetical protein
VRKMPRWSQIVCQRCSESRALYRSEDMELA